MQRQMICGPVLFLFLGVTAGLASPVQGQILRGPEILVNAGRAGSQGAPDVAVAPDGHSVVVWVDGLFPANVMARVLAADGTPRTGDLRVSTSEPDFQGHPRVAMAANGSFVVVWQARASQLEPSRVYGRRFSAGGQPLGARFRLGIGYHLEQSEPDVASAPNGRFVVAWTENDGKFDGAIPMTDVLSRRFAADGHPLAADFVAAGGWYNQYAPTVAVNASGAFVIGVEEYSESDAHDDGSTYVYAMSFGPDGKLLHFLSGFGVGEGFNQRTPSVALADDGTAVLAFEDDRVDDPDSFGLLAQRYDAVAGVAAGPLVHVNTTTKDDQSEPSIAMAPGGFLIAWTSAGGQDGDGKGVFAQRFAADGSKIGPETALASWRSGDQSLPAVSIAPSGHGLVVWQSMGRDGEGLGVAARRVFVTP
jgi:hypothetical protein